LMRFGGEEIPEVTSRKEKLGEDCRGRTRKRRDKHNHKGEGGHRELWEWPTGEQRRNTHGGGSRKVVKGRA